MVTFLSIGWILSLIISIIIITRLRKKNEEAFRETSELLETEKTLNYFATSLFRQNSVDDILWDVTKNCISKLHFEDCIVYLHDPVRNVLVQKAAYGPKNPDQFEILNPLEIPVGKGIVGAVFEKGLPEIIPDTNKDSRYIEDDRRRNSELTVPIIYQGKKFGIIDSEHSRKNFFSDKHLQVLSTIASLCAIKIDHALHEQAYHNAERKWQENSRKMAEIRLASLRMQLNPHFLFNSINSINNFIIHHENEQASGYLSTFSKLIREIFENTHSEWISLEKEIRLLSLYIELERLRFENKFSCNISINDTLDPKQVLVPPLLVQPFIENAIWHGLLHREGDSGELNIRYWRNNERLFVSIEDNGIGREYSSALKGNARTAQNKTGMVISDERIALMNEMFGSGIAYTVNDLVGNDEKAEGTRIVMSMMIKILKA